MKETVRTKRLRSLKNGMVRHVVELESLLEEAEETKRVLDKRFSHEDDDELDEYDFVEPYQLINPIATALIDVREGVKMITVALLAAQ